MMEQNTGWFSKQRVETFSDGVFAIIITLLVLEIKVPELSNHNSVKELADSLIELLPKFISWVISFFMLCVIWVNHHRIFEIVPKVTHHMFWLNAYLLLWCAFIPFPTALVGDYIENPLALSIFGLVLALVGSGFVLLRYSILKYNLSVKNINEKHFKRDTVKTIVIGIVLYLGGAMLAWASHLAALLLYLAIPFYFIFFNVKRSSIIYKV